MWIPIPEAIFQSKATPIQPGILLNFFGPSLRADPHKVTVDTLLQHEKICTSIEIFLGAHLDLFVSSWSKKYNITFGVRVRHRRRGVYSKKEMKAVSCFLGIAVW